MSATALPARLRPEAMTLAEALRAASQNGAASDAAPVRVALACSFSPMHLQTFVCGHLRQLMPERRVEIVTGLYDDLPGTLAAFASERVDAVLLVVEWADLDPRLGLRRLGGWSPAIAADAVSRAPAALDRLEGLAARAAECSPVIVSLPTLPLPPLFFTPGWQAGADQARLDAALGAFAAALAAHPRIRLLNRQALDAVSAPGERLDVKSTWMSGFPYRPAHASRLAELMAHAILNRRPLKGVITDLDNTLWRGVVGDAGPAALGWDLDAHAQRHGVYQQFLSALAAEGVLLAVASKNDPAIVEEAFRRPDLLLARDRVFPMAVGWGSKAQAVAQVLQAWNVHPDSVVFVDDSPMEIAEVQAAHPDVECVLFPAHDQGVYDLLVTLRDLFGRGSVSEEDALRLASLRDRAAAATATDASAGYSEAVLRAADAEITLEFGADARDARALELVNKTNQFNLNGRRYTEREWAESLARPGAFLLTASYRDRYGALGKIAVMTGRAVPGGVHLETWVMSCRAFARRIEHHCLQHLFDRFGPGAALTLDYAATERNGPMTSCLADLLGAAPSGAVTLEAERFEARRPELLHRVRLRDERSHERYADAAR